MEFTDRKPTRSDSTRVEIQGGIAAVTDSYLLEVAMSRYRWERKGLLARLVRGPHR